MKSITIEIEQISNGFIIHALALISTSKPPMDRIFRATKEEVIKRVEYLLNREFGF